MWSKNGYVILCHYCPFHTDILVFSFSYLNRIDNNYSHNLIFYD